MSVWSKPLLFLEVWDYYSSILWIKVLLLKSLDIRGLIGIVYCNTWFLTYNLLKSSFVTLALVCSFSGIITVLSSWPQFLFYTMDLFRLISFSWNLWCIVLFSTLTMSSYIVDYCKVFWLFDLFINDTFLFGLLYFGNIGYNYDLLLSVWLLLVISNINIELSSLGDINSSVSSSCRNVWCMCDYLLSYMSVMKLEVFRYSIDCSLMVCNFDSSFSIVLVSKGKLLELWDLLKSLVLSRLKY